MKCRRQELLAQVVEVPLLQERFLCHLGDRIFHRALGEAEIPFGLIALLFRQLLGSLRLHLLLADQHRADRQRRHRRKCKQSG
jgi:hypothetical protein